MPSSGGALELQQNCLTLPTKDPVAPLKRCPVDTRLKSPLCVPLRNTAAQGPPITVAPQQLK